MLWLVYDSRSLGQKLRLPSLYKDGVQWMTPNCERSRSDDAIVSQAVSRLQPTCQRTDTAGEMLLRTSLAERFRAVKLNRFHLGRRRQLRAPFTRPAEQAARGSPFQVFETPRNGAGRSAADPACAAGALTGVDRGQCQERRRSSEPVNTRMAAISLPSARHIHGCVVHSWVRMCNSVSMQAAGGGASRRCVVLAYHAPHTTHRT